MTVIRIREREVTRLRVMIDLADGRLTAEAARMLSMSSPPCKALFGLQNATDLRLLASLGRIVRARVVPPNGVPSIADKRQRHPR